MGGGGRGVGKLFIGTGSPISKYNVNNAKTKKKKKKKKKKKNKTKTQKRKTFTFSTSFPGIWFFYFVLSLLTFSSITSYITHHFS